jgi:hypothetical protein
MAQTFSKLCRKKRQISNILNFDPDEKWIIFVKKIFGILFSKNREGSDPWSKNFFFALC